MRLPALSLSLQFSLNTDAARHRAALPRHAVRRYLRHALACDATLGVRVVDLEEGQALNKQFRGRNYPTNVLTFDYATQPEIHADLVLCAPVIAREAREQRKSLAAHYAHMLVHGALHAQGWDHETGDAEAEAMEAREVEILARLGFRSPY